jgi:hypothetical protein
MARERVFTIYLPSNSPGAEPLHESEDTTSTISSYYKTTLDSTIDLTGEWTVGLAEVSSGSAVVLSPAPLTNITDLLPFQAPL